MSEKPKCKKCGKPCQYYGNPGSGYSVCCKKCNEKNATRQRVARARKKAESQPPEKPPAPQCKDRTDIFWYEPDQTFIARSAHWPLCVGSGSSYVLALRSFEKKFVKNHKRREAIKINKQFEKAKFGRLRKGEIIIKKE